MSETPKFQVGDKVNWTAVKSNGSRMSFSERRGVVTQVGNHSAEVKMRNGRKTRVRFDGLHKDGESHGVTNIFKAICEGAAKTEDAA